MAVLKYSEGSKRSTRATPDQRTVRSVENEGGTGEPWLAEIALLMVSNACRYGPINWSLEIPFEALKWFLAHILEFSSSSKDNNKIPGSGGSVGSETVVVEGVNARTIGRISGFRRTSILVKIWWMRP